MRLWPLEWFGQSLEYSTEDLHKFVAKEQDRMLCRLWRDSQDQLDRSLGKTSDNGTMGPSPTPGVRALLYSSREKLKQGEEGI